jgi:hypothetical protein
MAEKFFSEGGTDRPKWVANQTLQSRTFALEYRLEAERTG